jgi:hypothetical protein
MDKKSISNVILKNIMWLLFTIMATVNFMIQLNRDLYMSGGLNTLFINKVSYTLFELKLDITQGAYKHIYTITNYPLIPILAGVIYNIFILFKLSKNKLEA